jgi:hypothetical protein
MFVGSLIGTKCAHLEENFRTTGCRVNMGPETTTGFRSVVIEGNDVMKLGQAAEMVNRKVQEWQRKSGGQYRQF